MASTPTSTSGQRLLPSPPLHMWAPSESATPPTPRAAGRVTRRYPLLYKHFIEPTKGGIDGRTTLERLQALLMPRSTIALLPALAEMEHRLGEISGVLCVSPEDTLDAIRNLKRDVTESAAGSGRPPAEIGGSTDPTHGHVSEEAFTNAFANPAFRALCDTVAALDLTLARGRVAAIAATYSSNLILHLP